MVATERRILRERLFENRAQASFERFGCAVVACDAQSVRVAQADARGLWVAGADDVAQAFVGDALGVERGSGVATRARERGAREVGVVVRPVASSMPPGTTLRVELLADRRAAGPRKKKTTAKKTTTAKKKTAAKKKK